MVHDDECVYGPPDEDDGNDDSDDTFDAYGIREHRKNRDGGDIRARSDYRFHCLIVCHKQAGSLVLVGADFCIRGSVFYGLGGSLLDVVYVAFHPELAAFV